MEKRDCMFEAQAQLLLCQRSYMVFNRWKAGGVYPEEVTILGANAKLALPRCIRFDVQRRTSCRPAANVLPVWQQKPPIGVCVDCAQCAGFPPAGSQTILSLKIMLMLVFLFFFLTTSAHQGLQ